MAEVTFTPEEVEGFPQGPGTYGIKVENGTITLANFRVEWVEHGVNFAGAGVYGGSVIGARGHTSVSGAVVNIDPAVYVRPFYASIISAGAKYSVRDGVFHRAYKGDILLMEAPAVPAWDAV